MLDAASLFSLFFFCLSYKLLFWSNRVVSMGTVLLTVSCALAMTQVLQPNAWVDLSESVRNHTRAYTINSQSFTDLSKQISDTARYYLRAFVFM